MWLMQCGPSVSRSAVSIIVMSISSSWCTRDDDDVCSLEEYKFEFGSTITSTTSEEEDDDDAETANDKFVAAIIVTAASHIVGNNNNRLLIFLL